MKISKLFHWLYASLMFLPLAFITGRTLYTIFNPNAKDSYSDKTLSSNLQIVTSSDLIIAGNSYSVFKNSNSTGYSLFYGFTNIDLDLSSIFPNKTINYIGTYSDSNYNYLVGITSAYTDRSLVKLDSLTSFGFVSDGTFLSMGDNASRFTYYTYLYTSSTLDNSLIFSLNQLNEVPIFSWASSTYISQPLTYVTGLFGLEANNPINTLISYWFSVSIFWLVFDVMIYVPNLVHRWLDKGALE